MTMLMNNMPKQYQEAARSYISATPRSNVSGKEAIAQFNWIR
jgi:hypothetical protein